jgi:transcriptional regulator with GAF, ATPase, and Fis domain
VLKRGHRTTLEPHVFLALQADHPLASSARYRLTELEAVAFGRAPEGGVARFEKSDGGRFKMTVPDRWMSSSHAVLRKVLDQWVLQDLGSKNGTFVNGQRCERAALEDGDLIELGHTFFIFRYLVVTTLDPQSLEAGELRGSPPGLATLVPSLANEFGNLEAIAPSSVSVVIRGESGTGKELVAQAVHRLSNRPGEFVAVNCAALAKTLVESELFGYRKGAFSGAIEDRPGLIRSADHGTLFLDEIGDLPPEAQAAFLRVLQEGEVMPVGATRPVKVDIRLLAATHRDLEALGRDNQFRADLLARISGLTLTLPPLRERREDLGLLIGLLLRRHFASRAETIAFDSDAARAMLLYRWPLNIRELEKCLSAAVVLARGGTVEARHFPPLVQTALQVPKEKRAGETSAGDAAPDVEDGKLSEGDQRRREEILELLREHGGNVTAVARALGKARFQVQRWLKRYRIDSKSFRR